MCALTLGRLYVLNRHLENIQLRVLENSSVPFDVAFFVMQRQKEIKAADKAARPEGGACPHAHGAAK